MTESPGDKTICVIGRLCLQNQLLSRLLAERLGVTCLVALGPEAACALPGWKHDRETLFLCDCEGRDLVSFLRENGRIRKEIPDKGALGFFNVGGCGPKDPKVMNKRIKGVFRERVPIDGFVSGVSHLLKGDSRFPPDTAADDRAAESSGNRIPAGPKRALTPGEKKILALIREGKTNQQIAGTLGIKTKSVKNYTYRLFKKIEVSNRSQAALWAGQNHPHDAVL